MVRLTGLAWSKVTSVGVVVSAFESTGIYPFNCKKVPEYLFSNSYTNEIINPMETLLQLYQNVTSIPVEN
jgi:hypothetical protein